MAIREFEFKPGRFRAVQYEATVEGDNRGEIAELIGADQIIAADGSVAVWLEGGLVQELQPGWWVSVRDGAVFASSDAVRVSCWTDAE